MRVLLAVGVIAVSQCSVVLASNQGTEAIQETQQHRQGDRSKNSWGFFWGNRGRNGRGSASGTGKVKASGTNPHSPQTFEWGAVPAHSTSGAVPDEWSSGATPDQWSSGATPEQPFDEPAPESSFGEATPEHSFSEAIPEHPSSEVVPVPAPSVVVPVPSPSASAAAPKKSSSGALKGKSSSGGQLAAAPAGSSCCDTLSDELVGKVNTPYDVVAYQTELKTYWAAQPRELKPRCFVLPDNAADVSKALKIINAANERREGSCPFAVRSGGHTPIAESNNIDQGVTIDLSGMKLVSIAPSRKTVSIGPGNRWGEVYTKLDAAGLATTGGRVSSVGVGGLITGGGISFFTPRYGLVCDNVQNFEVVLPSGEVTSANNVTNPDLFRALRGGSSNVGIVTRFDMAAFEQGQFWGGLLTYLINSASLRQNIFSFFESVPKQNDPYAHLITSFTFLSLLGIDITAATSNVQYTKNDPNPAFFRPLTSRATTSTAKIAYHTDFANEIRDLNPDGSRQLFMSFSHKNSAEFMETIYQISQKHYKRAKPAVTGLQWSTSFQPLTAATVAKGAGNGGNSLGLEDAGDITVVLLTASYSSYSDLVVETAAREFFAEVQDEARKAGVYNRFIYLNYGAKFQDPIAAYGPASVSRLVAASQKYDPTGNFQKYLAGGFKISAISSPKSRPQPEPQEQPDHPEHPDHSDEEDGDPEEK